MSDDDDKDYKIGYGHPPQNQYPKGVSGNPKGRPKGSRNKKTTLKSFMETPLVDRNNKKTKVTTRDALLKMLLHKALVEKDHKSAKALLDMEARLCPELYKYGSEEGMAKRIAELEKELRQEKMNVGGGVLVVPEGVSLEKFLIEAEKQRQKMLADQEDFRKEMEEGKWTKIKGDH